MTRSLRWRCVVVSTLIVFSSCARAPEPFTPILEILHLPALSSSVRFAVFGDTGTGQTAEYQIGETAVLYRDAFPFDFALLLGDNLYGLERPQDYERKFSEPFRPLLDAGVEFYAVLGNHDERTQRFFAPFHMGGHSYYAFRRGNARFFALESDYMTPEQLSWLDEELRGADSDWKICFMHHPLYSSGITHGPTLPLRQALEPILVRNHVDVVFAGHEHSYERFTPQQGITYIVAGGSAKLSPGNVRGGPDTAARYDQDNSFMLVDIEADQLWFRTIDRTGAVVDAGLITHANATDSLLIGPGTPLPEQTNRQESENAKADYGENLSDPRTQSRFGETS